jgi:hypothetical protein
MTRGKTTAQRGSRNARDGSATTPQRARMHKSHLPEKICMACGRPMVWRRRWARTWDAVRYCSDRCRGAARKRDLQVAAE